MKALKALLLLSIITLTSLKEEEEKPKNGILGIDVSLYQGEIDWATVAQSGINFAIIRSTLGGGSLDEKFEQNYAGKVSQDESGRALFKASIISYLTELQNAGAIINFNSTTDVMVEAGEQVDAYYSEIYIQPTYSVDKLYMIVNVR